MTDDSFTHQSYAIYMKLNYSIISSVKLVLHSPQKFARHTHMCVYYCLYYLRGLKRGMLVLLLFKLP